VDKGFWMNACSKDERSVGADDEDGKNLSSRLAEMAAAVEARDAFLAVAAHELRNPITPLVGQVDLLLAGVKSRKYSIEQVEKHLERIQHILSRYVRRASVLLDVSRMTTDKLLLYPEPCDLATLLRDLVDEFAEIARRTGTAVTLAVPESLPGTWDPVALEQIIDNLLSNALKYGGQTPVELSAEVQGGQVLIQVRDYGPGIAPAARARVFERFERAIAQGEQQGGFGIGLWVVAQHVKMMAGSITIDDPPGGGARFTVTLPIDTKGSEL
jgi:two-component system OmpR family sensor kinase